VGLRGSRQAAEHGKDQEHDRNGPRRDVTDVQGGFTLTEQLKGHPQKGPRPPTDESDGYHSNHEDDQQHDRDEKVLQEGEDPGPASTPSLGKKGHLPRADARNTKPGLSQIWLAGVALPLRKSGSPLPQFFPQSSSEQ
jgi:hypothetical protein